MEMKQKHVEKSKSWEEEEKYENEIIDRPTYIEF
jgi:hypothetical protein